MTVVSLPHTNGAVIIIATQPLTPLVVERVKASWHKAWDEKKPDRPVLMMLPDGSRVEFIASGRQMNAWDLADNYEGVEAVRQLIA